MEQHGGFNISAWAIRNPVPIILFWVTLCVFGVSSYLNLGINDRPDVDFPLVVVSVGRPGASATELETDVTKKIEDSLTGIAHVEHINSTVSEGASTTILQLEIGTNSETALSDVRDAVSRIRQSLPADINEPIIMHPSTAGLPFLTYTVSSPTRSVADLSRLVDQDISRAMLAVSGVSEVQRAGGLTRQVRVTLDASRLQALGTTVENVNLQLRALNLNLPGGQAKLDEGTQGIRTLGAARTVEDLKAAPIILSNGVTARLDTLGKVEDTYAEVTQLARLDGKPVVSFSLIRTQGAPLVQTEAAARQAVETLQKRLPADVHLDLVRSMGPTVRNSFRASVDALALGALLAVVVIFIFLRQWQATIIAGLAIPLSILPTFAVMRMFGYSLNFITLLGLTLVVGILVDDAIVDLENIERHIAQGKSRMRAAIEATNEIGLAVVATTMTIVAVFVPVSFMGGIAGLFFKPFGVTVAVAVLFSLLVARTATPLMAAYMLPEHVGEEREPAYRAFYTKMLGKAINHRWIAMFTAAVVFVGSLCTIPFIGTGFFAQADESEVDISVSLPSGSSVEATDQVVQAITAKMMGKPGVRKVYATVGSAVSNVFQPSAGGINNATVAVLLVPVRERRFSASEFANQIRPEVKTIPGARVDVVATGGVGSAKPVNLILRGEDPDELLRIADRVTSEMRGLPMLRDVQNTAAELHPEVHVKPDFQRAAEQGVSVQAIGRAVRLATQGESTVNLPKFNAGDQQIDILVTLNTAVQHSMSDIQNVRVQGVRGLVPLESVADVTRGAGPVSISRADRLRQVTFSANLASGDLGSAMKAVYALPSLKHLPASVSTDTSGQAKFQADFFAAFGGALGAGVMFIYMVLVLLFGNFLQPITIMMALPLSFAGAFMGLLIFHQDMGMMALIGIVMLMGLVTKNSILLVDHALEGRKRGLSRRAALIDAGHDRVRPILMTTIAMICGMLPIALALGEGTERLSPMACAVIGGLITSTLLTLMIVPAFFTLVDDFQRFVRRKLFGMVEEQPEAKLPATVGGGPPRPRSALRRLMGYLAPHKLAAASAFLAILITLAANLATPLFIRMAVDEGVGKHDSQALLTAIGCLVGAAVVRGLFGYLNSYLGERTSQHIAYKLRQDLFEKVQRLSFSYYDQTESGQLLTRLTNDVDQVRTFIASGIAQLAQSIIMLVVSIVLIVSLDWKLALLTLVSVVPIVFVLGRFTKVIRPMFMQVMGHMSRMSTILRETLAGVRMVRAFGREAHEAGRYEAVNAKLLETAIATTRMGSNTFPFIMFFSTLGTIVIVGFGGWQVMNDKLTLGTLLAFTSYLGFLLQPLMMMGFSAIMIARASASATRIVEIFDAPVEVTDKPGAIPLPPIEGRVEFQDVGFRYPGGETDVLSGVSFAIAPGETVAIVGMTGSGKSTLAHLLPRFYDVTAGSVSIDGHDVRDVTLSSLRGQLAIVLQEPLLFSGTVAENIAYGNPNATREAIEQAARAAQAHDFIGQLPFGYDTVIGERGVGLSGGQRQRVAIARALLVNPRLIVLDDSTSAVDTQTERAIQGALDRLMREANRTCLVIAHRFSTLRDADRILVLDKGKLVGQGTHAELMRGNAVYQDIVGTQFTAGRTA